jgi:pimeloyl-ACP methyl ester carboxylesterase
MKRTMTTSTREHAVDPVRRRLLHAASAVLAMFPVSAVKPRSASALSSPTAFGPLRQIDAGDLNVGYVDAGSRDGPPVILVHGWPYDIHSYAEVTPLLVSHGFRVIVPYLRGFGTTRFQSSNALRNGQQAAIALDVIALMDALGLPRAVLGGFDWGARAVNCVAALWPERCRAMVSVSGYLIANREVGTRPLPPQVELNWWYQFYFATERGRAGYGANRREFAKLIWKLGSPKWKFDDATFDLSATALDNPDHVDVVIHNYRWRIGAAPAESRYDVVEARLEKSPSISVPTITLEGDANGAPHPDSTTYAEKFTGAYEHRLIKGGIGHNLPQEAPHAFVDAVIDVARRRA